MEGVNLVVLSGNVCSDPELRTLQNGSAVLSFRLATTERVKRGDVWEDHSEYHAIVVWGSRAVGLARYMGKGGAATVTGCLRTSSYTDREGVKRWRTQVHADRIVLQGGRREPATEPAAPLPAAAAGELEAGGAPGRWLEPDPRGDAWEGSGA